MNDHSVLKSNALVAENWCHTRISKVEQCSFVWTIHNYLEYHYHSNNHIKSSEFKSRTNDKCVWSLTLHAPADDWISINLILNCNEEWCEKVLVKCKVSVVDNENEETNICQNNHYSSLTRAEFKHYLSFKHFLNCLDISSIKDLLTDDKLTIFCELKFITYDDNVIKNFFGESVVPEKSDLHCTLRDDLKRLFKNETLSDFTILVSGEEYRVHKNILAARSTVFATMFQQDMIEKNENRLEINDLDPEIVVEMLCYMYTGQTRDLENRAADILAAADKYDLQTLKNMCQYAIIRKLSIENVADSLILADLYRATLLKDQAIQFFKIHSVELTKTTSWTKLKEYDYKLFEEVFEKMHS